MEKKWRGEELLKDLLIIPAFREYVEAMRDEEEGLWWVMHRYRIPARLWDVVKWYMKTGEVDFQLALPAVEVDQTNGVALRLIRDITKEELLEYIEEHWSDEIIPALDWMNEPRERLPVPYTPELDRRIYLDYLNKDKLGLENQGIATRNNTDLSKVNRVIKRFKNLAQGRS